MPGALANLTSCNIFRAMFSMHSPVRSMRIHSDSRSHFPPSAAEARSTATGRRIAFIGNACQGPNAPSGSTCESTGSLERSFAVINPSASRASCNNWLSIIGKEHLLSAVSPAKPRDDHAMNWFPRATNSTSRGAYRWAPSSREFRISSWVSLCLIS